MGAAALQLEHAFAALAITHDRRRIVVQHMVYTERSTAAAIVAQRNERPTRNHGSRYEVVEVVRERRGMPWREA